jgi:hypothetical protein
MKQAAFAEPLPIETVLHMLKQCELLKAAAQPILGFKGYLEPTQQ